MSEAPESPEPALVHDATADEVPADEPVAMNRAQRRAAARGGPAQKIAGPHGGPTPAPPVRQRNFKSRKGG